MAAFTKLVIMRVFENLLSVKPLEKITVKDITDQCGISRNTFYYHYQDIYQVFKAYIDYSLEEIFKFLRGSRYVRSSTDRPYNLDALAKSGDNTVKHGYTRSYKTIFNS